MSATNSQAPSVHPSDDPNYFQGDIIQQQEINSAIDLGSYPFDYGRHPDSTPMNIRHFDRIRNANRNEINLPPSPPRFQNAHTPLHVPMITVPTLEDPRGHEPFFLRKIIDAAESYIKLECSISKKEKLIEEFDQLIQADQIPDEIKIRYYAGHANFEEGPLTTQLRSVIFQNTYNFHTEKLQRLKDEKDNVLPTLVESLFNEANKILGEESNPYPNPANVAMEDQEDIVTIIFNKYATKTRIAFRISDQINIDKKATKLAKFTEAKEKKEQENREELLKLLKLEEGCSDRELLFAMTNNYLKESGSRKSSVNKNPRGNNNNHNNNPPTNRQPNRKRNQQSNNRFNNQQNMNHGINNRPNIANSNNSNNNRRHSNNYNQRRNNFNNNNGSRRINNQPHQNSSYNRYHNGQDQHQHSRPVLYNNRFYAVPLNHTGLPQHRQ